MMIKKIMKQMVILLLLISFNTNANTLNTFSITTATLAAAVKPQSHCLRYKIPTHFCIWLSPVAGKNLTPVLDHYLPDVVVTVYRNSDENPWVEAKESIDKISSAAQKSAISNVGGGNHIFLDSHEQQVIFKEADVIGNPALMVLKGHHLPLLLQSTARPFKAYYQSMLDSLLWRGFMPGAASEEAFSIGLGFSHHVGCNLTDWGGVYPHEGTVTATDDAKGSMVIAQRASDLLTNSQFFGHARKKLPTSCGKHCKAAPIKENNEDTLFQLIYPIEQDECVVFGSEKSYTQKMLNKEGAYAWIVWRHYVGCPDGDGEFLGEI